MINSRLGLFTAADLAISTPSPEVTGLEGTKLIMNVIPGMAECDECDEIFNVIEHEGYCPNCGSFEKSILTGQDFTIKEIHVSEE